MGTYYLDPAGNDSNAGTSTGAAWLTLAHARSVMATNDILYVKTGTYDFSANVNFPGSTYQGFQIIGYSVTPGDNPTGSARPVFRATAAINPLSFDSYGAVLIACLRFDGNSATGTQGLVCNVYAGNTTRVLFCSFYGWSSIGMYNEGRATVERCDASGNGAGGFGSHSAGNPAGGIYDRCVSKNNTGSGFKYLATAVVKSCVSSGNSGYGVDCFGNSGYTSVLSSVLYGNSLGGVDADGGNCQIFGVDSVAYANGGYGYQDGMFVGCAAGSSTSDDFHSSATQVNSIATLTADPFVDAVNGDFNINNVSGGGALLRAVTYDLPG